MGPVTIIVIGAAFSINQIPKSNNSVFRQYKILRRRNSGIKYGDGDSPSGIDPPRWGFAGKRICFQRHGKHLPSFFIKICRRGIFGKVFRGMVPVGTKFFRSRKKTFALQNMCRYKIRKAEAFYGKIRS